MAFREVGVVEVREVLRGWLEGRVCGRSRIGPGWTARPPGGMSRRRQAAGLCRDDGPEALTDELIGAVIAAVRPARPDGHGAAWEELSAREVQIPDWVGKDGLSIVKIEELLARSGCVVPYRTLHRFAVARCGFRARGPRRCGSPTASPGWSARSISPRWGSSLDAETGRRRKVHALIFTAVVSRHMFVWLSYSADAERGDRRVRGGVGVLRRGVQGPDPGQPQGRGHRRRRGQPAVEHRAGWTTPSMPGSSPTRPGCARPQDKPRVERVVQYVRGNFWAGETFPTWPGAQAAATDWCRGRPGCGSTAPPLPVRWRCSPQLESRCLLPVPRAYDVPMLRAVKVHRDFHVEIAQRPLLGARSTDRPAPRCPRRQ